MGFWILESSSMEHVPGTTLLDEKSAHAEDHTANLKHAPGRPELILVPQPSDDPNDPLNWPQWQKEFCTLVVSVLAMIGTGTLGPILTPGANQIIAEFDVTFTDIAVLTGYQLLSIACVGPLVVVVARIWGKRPVYVISAWIIIIGVIVAASAQSYNALLAGRIVQGIGGACFEGLVTPFIGDLYFVHQRGARIAAYTMALWTGSMFGLIPTGVITQNLSWRWTFIIAGIFLAVFAVLLTLCVPESSYLRASVYDLDVNGDEGLDTLNAKGVVMQELQADKEGGGQAGAEGSSYGPRKTWIQRMSLYNGRFSSENPIKMILRPWALLLHFPLFWNMIFTGMSQVFSVGISYLIPAVYGVPPYNLSPAQLGYIGAGPVCGVILASIFSGFTFDRVATWAARRNNGIYEPEFRLYFAAPAIVLSGIGLYGFGLGIDAGQGYIVTGMFYGFAIGALIINMNTGFSYMLDAYRSISMETFVAAVTFKNFMFFGFSYFFNNWIESAGAKDMFLVCGSVAIAVLLTAAPMYFFGKRIRAFYARHDILKWLHLDPAPGQDSSTFVH